MDQDAQVELNLDAKEAQDSRFLDKLIEMGLLNVQTSMIQSIREMVHDNNPFYESIHINVISALMEHDTRSHNLDSMVQYLDRSFETFDSAATYPYDIEDAILMWMNQCFNKFKQDENTSVFLKDIRLSEFEDLAKDMDNGWMMCMVIASYFRNIGRISFDSDTSALICKHVVSVDEKLKNYDVLEDIVSKIDGLQIPWLPIDMISKNQERGTSQRYTYSGNASYLLINFLSTLLTLIAKQGLEFAIPKRIDSGKNSAGKTKLRNRNTTKQEPFLEQNVVIAPIISTADDSKSIDAAPNNLNGSEAFTPLGKQSEDGFHDSVPTPAIKQSPEGENEAKIEEKVTISQSSEFSEVNQKNIPIEPKAFRQSHEAIETEMKTEPARNVQALEPKVLPSEKKKLRKSSSKSIKLENSALKSAQSDDISLVTKPSDVFALPGVTITDSFDSLNKIDAVSKGTTISESSITSEQIVGNSRQDGILSQKDPTAVPDQVIPEEIKVEKRRMKRASKASAVENPPNSTQEEDAATYSMKLRMAIRKSKKDKSLQLKSESSLPAINASQNNVEKRNNSSLPLLSKPETKLAKIKPSSPEVTKLPEIKKRMVQSADSAIELLSRQRSLIEIQPKVSKPPMDNIFDRLERELEQANIQVPGQSIENLYLTAQNPLTLGTLSGSKHADEATEIQKTAPVEIAQNEASAGTIIVNKNAMSLLWSDDEMDGNHEISPEIEDHGDTSSVNNENMFPPTHIIGKSRESGTIASGMNFLDGASSKVLKTVPSLVINNQNDSEENEDDGISERDREVDYSHNLLSRPISSSKIHKTPVLRTRVESDSEFDEEEHEQHVWDRREGNLDMTDNIIDLYEPEQSDPSEDDEILPEQNQEGLVLEEKTIVEEPVVTIARPSTGLQSYPIPDGSNNEDNGEKSWDRARMPKVTIKNKLRKPKEIIHKKVEKTYESILRVKAKLQAAEETKKQKELQLKQQKMYSCINQRQS